MSERLTMLRALEEKRRKRRDLAVRAEGLIREIRDKVMPFSITPLEELPSGDAKDLTAELHDVRMEYIQVLEDIRDIERRVG